MHVPSPLCMCLGAIADVHPLPQDSPFLSRLLAIKGFRQKDGGFFLR